jgi:hypothetical protein
VKNPNIKEAILRLKFFATECAMGEGRLVNQAKLARDLETVFNLLGCDEWSAHELHVRLLKARVEKLTQAVDRHKNDSALLDWMSGPAEGYKWQTMIYHYQESTGREKENLRHALASAKSHLDSINLF